MGFTAFVGKLKIHEMEIKVREDRKPHKKIGVAFKTSPSEHKKKSVTTPTISDDEHESTPREGG